MAKIKRPEKDLQDDIRDLAIGCKKLANQTNKLWVDYCHLVYGKPEVTHLPCDACERETMNFEDIEIRRFSQLFGIDSDDIKIEMDKGLDIITAISKITGIERSNLKLIAHGIMYSLYEKEFLNAL